MASEVIAPPPPLDLNRWARENVRFGSESPFQGPYNSDLFPFFARILEVLGPEHPSREVVIKKSAQLGGTVIAQIFVGGSMDIDPCGIMYIHPTADNASRWSKTKWKPMLRQSTALSGLFADPKSRDAASSTLYMERRDGRGWLQISGANSEASLSMISVKKQVQDDLSKWENNDAGDPETQADSRSKAFAWAKILKIGTPLVEPGCRISKAFENSTQEHFHVRCPHCDHLQALEWENMLAYIEEFPDEDPCFTCPACGGLIEQHHRAEMNRRGEWVAHKPAAKVIGFHLWTAYSPLTSWASIRDDWFKAKGDPAKEKAFMNDGLGRAYKGADESPPWETVRDRAANGDYKLGIIPLGGLKIVIGMDCQGDRVEWHCKAFGRDLRRWTIDYGMVEGHISDTETRAKLDAVIAQTWKDEFGNRRGVDMVAIDGNAYTEDVFDWAKRHPASKVMMVRGAKSDLAPPLVKVKREKNKEGKPLRYAGRFFNVGVAGMKMALYANLKKTDPLARGFCGYPAGLDDDFFQQLCAERRVLKKTKTGFDQYQWIKDAAQRNEVLDTENYCEAAALRLGWRTLRDEAWDALEAELEKPQPGRQTDFEDLLMQPQPSISLPAPPRPAQQQQQQQQRGNIASRLA